MTKKCYSCLLVTIAEYNEEKSKNSSNALSPRENNVPPPSTSIASQNDDNNPPTIPTSVALERVDFVPPEDICINDGEGLPLQNGFSKNSGIFLKNALYVVKVGQMEVIWRNVTA